MRHLSRRAFLASAVSGAALLLAACGQAAPTPAPPKPVDTGKPVEKPAEAPKPTAEPAKPTAEPTKPTAAAPAAPTKPVEAKPTAEQAKPGPTVAPAAKPGATKFQGQIVISIIQQVPEEAQAALTDAYKKVRPDVSLVWELPGGGAGQYPTWLGTQLAAGNIRPDIVSGNYVSSYAKYYNFEQVRKTINPHTNNPWDKDLDWDFFRARNAKGERNMLPSRAVHTMWFYNKEMLAKANVKPPQTWAEFADVCQKLKLAGFTPVAANYTFQVPQWLAEIYFDQYHVDWIQAVRAQKGDWSYDPGLDDKFNYDPKDPFIHTRYTYNPQRYWKGIRDGLLKYDTPQMAEIIKNMAEIFPKHATSDLFVMQDSYPPFLQQQCAIMCNGSWSLPTLANDMKAMTPDRLKELKLDEKTSIRPFEWGFFENPSMEGPLVKTTAKSVESATGEYISIVDKSQGQTELVLDLVMYWLSKAGYQPFLEGYIKSGSRFRPSGPLMVKGVEDPPEIQKMFGDIKFVGNAEINYNNFLGWGGGGSPHMRTSFNIYKDALEGKMPPAEFGRQIQSLITTNFDDLLKRAQLTKEDVDNPAKQPGT
ncbi:MAG TPA: hypothetical protein VG370_06580 [Chloroflexota bacterium]|jgi:ABC-type glycerol-3-phosphate transport system substrate-binding protein|nr:hypothetical protein [Chloroflexota bacterium]